MQTQCILNFNNFIFQQICISFKLQVNVVNSNILKNLNLQLFITKLTNLGAQFFFYHDTNPKIKHTVTVFVHVGVTNISETVFGILAKGSLSVKQSWGQLNSF